MRTFYILGSDTIKTIPAPKDFDLFEIEAETLKDAMSIAMKNSNKRYFCSLKLTSLIKE